MFNEKIKKYIEKSDSTNRLISVFTHTHTSKQIQQLRGNLYTMVNIVLGENISAREGINIFLDELEKVYFSSLPLNIPNILEKAIKSALFKLNDFLEKNDAINDVTFEFGCVAIKHDIVYLARVGETNIFLIRDNKLLNLGDSLADISNPKLVEAGSGIIKSGDRIILTNKASNKLIDDWVLFSRYSDKELNTLVNPSKDDEEKIAFIIVEIENKESFQADTTLNDSKGESFEDAKKKLNYNFSKSRLALSGGGHKVLEYVIKSLKEDVFPLFLKLATFTKVRFKSIYDNRQVIKGKIQDFGTSCISFFKKIRGSKNVDFSTFAFKAAKIPIIKKKILNRSETLIEPKKYLDKIGVIFQFLKKINLKKLKLSYFLWGGVVLAIFIISYNLFRGKSDYNTRFDKYKTLVALLSDQVSKIQKTGSTNVIDSTYNESLPLINEAYLLDIDNKKIDEYKNEILKKEYSVHNIVDISSKTKVLYDFSNTSFSPSNLDFLGDNSLVVISNKSSSIFSLSLDKNPVISSEIKSDLLVQPISVAALKSGNAILFDKNNGVLSIDKSNKVSTITGLSYIKKIISIATYDDNIYMLASDDKAIFKSIHLPDGYTIPTRALSDNNLADTSAIAVDGDFYVASPSTGILLYSSSSELPFNISGKEKIRGSLGPITAVYTTEFIDKLYLLDPQNKRVLQLQKGEDHKYTYLKEFSYFSKEDLFSRLTSFAIDKKDQKMYLVSGKKILVFNIL